MGEVIENTYTENTLLPGASGSVLEDWTCEFSFFFPSEENVDLCLANVCCVVEERKTLKSYYFHSWFIFCFYPRKGCKSVLGKSYSLEQLKMIMVKVVLTE